MKGQIKRLSKDPALLAEYDSIIKAQEKTGIIEKVSPNESISNETKIHYVPRQAVVRKDATTTKLRIVYDASAKSHKSAVALNDCLEAGPSLNPLLFDILLRFREKRIAIVANIEKAFLNEAGLAEYLISSLDTVLDKYPNAGVMLVGDFNRFNFRILSNNFNLRQLVKAPTRGSATLDLILTNLFEHFSKPDILAGIGLSDHKSILIRPLMQVKREKSNVIY